MGTIETKMGAIEEIHMSLVNGQRRQMVEQIDEYGVYYFWADYKNYKEEIMVIVARRWFDKKNGNTYHSVKVYDDNNKLIGKNSFEYGYGDHYLQTAHEILQKEGHYPKTTRKRYESGISKDYIQFLDDIRNNKFLVSCTDVGRRKDL